jgi:hypothetical protein
MFEEVQETVIAYYVCGANYVRFEQPVEPNMEVLHGQDGAWSVSMTRNCEGATLEIATLGFSENHCCWAEELSLSVPIQARVGGTTYYGTVTGTFRMDIENNMCCVPEKDPWSAEVTYELNDLVLYGGAMYRSLQDGNLNHEPLVDPEWADWWVYVPKPCVITVGDACVEGGDEGECVEEGI